MANSTIETRALGAAARGLLVTACLGLLTSPAWAALGQTADSVVSDQERLHGELRSIDGEGFVVQEITSADGSVVREYLTQGGSVFAVAWRGMTRPDLAQLLGAHFEEFREASRSTTRGRRPLLIRTPQLVVEMGGHMRASHGRAYLPGKVPVALSSDAIR
jgi:hypothetical protein